MRMSRNFRGGYEGAINLWLQSLAVTLMCFLFFFHVKSITALQIVFCLSLSAVIHHVFRFVAFPSFCHWFLLAYVPLFMLYPITLPLFSEQFPVSMDTLLGYGFLTIVGIHLFLFGYALSRRKGGSHRLMIGSVYLDYRILAVAVWLLIGCIAGSFLLRAAETGSLSQALAASRNEIKESGGGLRFYAGYLLNFAVIVFALLPSYLSRARWTIPVIIPGLVVLDFLIFLYSRGRAWMIMHLVSLMMGWLFLKPLITIKDEARRRKIGSLFTRRFFVFLTLFICIALFGVYLRLARTYIGSAGDIADLEFSETIEHAFVYGEFGFAPTVFEVLELFPDHEPFLGGQSYYRLFFAPIPRQVWPDKPLSTARVLGDILRPDAHDDQTNTAGVTGDLYVNFGYFGVLGMFAFGWLFGWMDRKRGFVAQLVVCCAFVPVFDIVRGAFTAPVLVLLVITLSSYLFARMARVKEVITPRRLAQRGVRGRRTGGSVETMTISAVQ